MPMLSKKWGNLGKGFVCMKRLSVLSLTFIDTTTNLFLSVYIALSFPAYDLLQYTNKKVEQTLNV